MTNRYVYGIVDGETIEFETDAVAGAECVYTISHRRLGAVVSDIDTTDPEDTDEDAQRHDDVLREIMDYDGGTTVVPMQFGMAFEGDRELKNVLRGARPAFRRAMTDIEGRFELGLKLVREDDTAVDREAIEADIEDRLEPIAAQSVENDLFSDRLVLNRSYLVGRDERETFDDAVADFEADHDELMVRYTGPFAPYSFVDVKIGAQ
ncbi:GvpL/GvpF family gas vesicle protein [Natrinema hispanicum]|uniref:Gas vesicle synthesis protein GvpL/GvpF n=1 Tax=Natrinema hispanicum TaxID=392421 RepID=A0A1I0CHU4_9EURY|nr:GvpL/GvpF family gas vesicle protein [Natrinema hispanicum]SDC47691.1 Gas vesicle synthesis protein GvpL/GvpF [Natrinema hispanicum]SET19099.1 Gas vesicle synthesis protein GvpL/GvpF [Natrinema hispanicum]